MSEQQTLEEKITTALNNTNTGSADLIELEPISKLLAWLDPL